MTKAGERLLGKHHGYADAVTRSRFDSYFEMRDAIAAIEAESAAEARAAFAASLRAKVEGLPHTVPFREGRFQRAEFMVMRAAVLTAIDEVEATK